MKSFRELVMNEKLITFGGKAYPKFGQVVILAGGAGSGKGFVKLIIDSNQIEAKFMYVSDIKSKQYQLTDTNRFIIKHNQPI